MRIDAQEAVGDGTAPATRQQRTVPARAQLPTATRTAAADDGADELPLPADDRAGPAAQVPRLELALSHTLVYALPFLFVFLLASPPFRVECRGRSFLVALVQGSMIRATTATRPWHPHEEVQHPLFPP